MGASSLDSPFSFQVGMKQRMRGLGMLSPREELVKYDKIQGFISETLAVIENDIWVLMACQLSTTDLIFEIVDHLQRVVSSAILFSASVSKRMLFADWPLASHRSVCSLASLRVDPIEGPPKISPRHGGHISVDPHQF